MEEKRNYASLSGVIVSPFYLSQETEDGLCYMVYVSVQRLSDTEDVIPVMVPAKLLPSIIQDETGRTVYAEGNFQSRNRRYGGKSHLDLFLYAEVFEFDIDSIHSFNNNIISLDGFLCKKPILRITPLGRSIADIFIAVNRPNGRSDYIPCIAWGENARYSENLTVGDRIHVKGRMQSREYTKKIDEGKYEKRIAYEVSCGAIDSESKKVNVSI